MPPKYVFNHVALYDAEGNLWKIYHKHSKKIPKKVDCYGSKVIASSEDLEEAKRLAIIQGVKPWDIQVIE